MSAAALCLLASCLQAPAPGVADPPTLTTAGLQWVLDPQGAIARMRLGPITVDAQPGHGGLWVRPAPGAELLPVPLDARGQSQTTEYAAAGLRVAVQVESRPDHLLVTGTVEDLQDKDRGVDLTFRLPMPEAVWWSRISETFRPGDSLPVVPKRREKLPPGAAVLERAERDGLSQNVLPVACVTDAQARTGVALAIPPDFPCMFNFVCRRDPDGLELTLPVGLSPAAEGPWKRRAEFRFLAYPVDGQWGLRDALRRYYALFPKSFARRTQSSGLWLFAVHSLDQVPDPDNYAFWEGPRLTELARAESHHIETYPYIIVGQRELTYLQQKPAGYEDVLEALREKPAQTGRGRQGWKAVQESVETSGLHDPRGRWIHLSRNTDWGGPSLTFPVNPSPWIPATADRPTVASRALADVEKLLQEYPSLSGIYVDSLASWGSYANYRRDHFAAARAPLTHDPAGRVYIPNWMPHVDFLHALHERIGSRLVFGNGIRPGRAFPAFVCDLLGVECSTGDTKHRRNLDFYRAVAGSKPFLSLFYYPAEEIPRPVAERYVQRFVAMGLSPEVKGKPWGCHKQRDADLYARFLPLYRRLDLAGWQPVTHARVKSLSQDGRSQNVRPSSAEKSADPETDPESLEVWVERFGTAPPNLYFTLYNPSEKPAKVLLEFDSGPQALGLAPGCAVKELVEDKLLKAGTPISIPPETLRVLQFDLPAAP